MEHKPVNTQDLELELLKHRENERKESDGRYAPMIVKTILYGLLGTIAAGVVFGIGDLVIKSFINKLDPEAYPVQEAKLPAAAIESIHDLP